MKRILLMMAFLFTVTISLNSCRETTKEQGDVEEAVEDTGDAIEDAADDVEDAVEEGVNEVEENTGTGGTDDN